MSFVRLTYHVGKRNQVLDGVQITQWEEALLRGDVPAHCNVTYA